MLQFQSFFHTMTPNLEFIDTDVSREWITYSKIVHLFRLLFQSQTTKVLAYAKTFSDIDFAKLKASWIQAIILDVDDCIAPHHGEILPENKDIIEWLLKDFKIVVFSNMKKSNRYEELEKLWIQIVTSPFAKPDARWFEQCLETLWTRAEQTVCIWDNYVTDGGCKNAGIEFIKVSPIQQDKHRSINRKVQIAFQSLVDKIAQKRWHIPYS